DFEHQDSALRTITVSNCWSRWTLRMNWSAKETECKLTERDALRISTERSDIRSSRSLQARTLALESLRSSHLAALPVSAGRELAGQRRSNNANHSRRHCSRPEKRCPPFLWPAETECCSPGECADAGPSQRHRGPDREFGN